MKRYQKVLLVTSACLIVGGGVMGVAGLALGGSRPSSLQRRGYRRRRMWQKESLLKKSCR